MMGTTLLDAASYEHRRLISLRSTHVFLGAIAVFAIIGGVSLFFQQRDAPRAPLTGDHLVSNITFGAPATGIPIVALFLGLMAVFAATDDFRTGQGLVTYVATSRRSVVLSAKLAVLSMTGIVVTVGYLTLALLVALLLGRSTLLDALDASAVTALVLGHLLADLLWIGIGLGAGILVRAPAGVISLLILTPLVFEVLMAAAASSWDVTESLARLTPFRAATRLLQANAQALDKTLLDVAVVLLASAGISVLGLLRLQRTDIADS